MATATASTAPDEAAVDTKQLIPVSFWGICDIKYDPRLPNPSERVRVLEFGDGRSSRFSHHGRAIKDKFDNEYCMDPNPIKRAVMTENKKFTHDMFVQEGFAHLRPPTVAYPRRYTPALAEQICADLDVEPGRGAVVLKLCNRSRGAGIVVATATDLDGALGRLLSPPLGEELQELLRYRVERALEPDSTETLEEQCLHWWSNECPLFVAERCCHSIPVRKNPQVDETFDGTMRVAFALYRHSLNKYKAQMEVQGFSVDWLGGYWKLPPRAETASATKEPGGEDARLEELHGRIVSSFNSTEKRTAEVLPEHLQEVYDAVGPALPRIFGSGVLGVNMIMNFYREAQLFKAFALSRAAAALRAQDMTKARGLFDLATRDLPKRSAKCSPQTLPEDGTYSYIDRNLGVCAAMRNDWQEALRYFRSSLVALPHNSTAYYLEGCALQETGQWAEARNSQLNSIAMDPDFKSPYIALGNCCLLLGRFYDAVKASKACLRRHVNAPGALFNIAQAYYQLVLMGGLKPELSQRDIEEEILRDFEIAKKSMPEQWSEEDEAKLNYVQANASIRHRLKMPNLPVHVWKVYGWRP